MVALFFCHDNWQPADVAEDQQTQRRPVGALRRAIRAADLRLSFLGVSFDVQRVLREVKSSEDDLDHQINDAFAALGKSSALIGDLESALRVREERLRSLQAEHERISQLAALTRPQAEAVAASLERVIGDSSRRERFYAILINLGIGLLIYVLGVLTSDWVGRLLS